MKKETILLIARNVVNTDNIKEYLTQLASYAVYEGGKKWIQSNLYKYIINNFKASKVTKAEPDSPEWLVNAISAGQEVFYIKLSDKDKQSLRHTADYLNTADKDWSRVSYTDMEEHVKVWDKELKRQAKIAADSENFTPFLNVDNLQWVDVDTEEGLRDEGAKMGHCVGSYWNSVERGRSKIFSLRDKNFENPHVTIEIYKSDAYKHLKWIVGQVKGNGNTIPVKYKQQIKEFLLAASKKFKGLNIECHDVSVLKLDIYQVGDRIFGNREQARTYILDTVKKLKSTIVITTEEQFKLYQEYTNIAGSDLYKDRDITFNIKKKKSYYESTLAPLELTTEDLSVAKKVTAKAVHLTIYSKDIKKLMSILGKLNTPNLTLLGNETSSPIVIGAFPPNLKKSSVLLRSDNFELDPEKRYIGTVKALKSTVPALRNQLMAENLHPESTKIKSFSYDKSKIKNKNLLKIVDAVETKSLKEVMSLLKKIADNNVTVGYVSTSIKFLQDLMLGLNFDPMKLSKRDVVQLAETFKALLTVVTSSSKLYSALSYTVQGQIQKRGSGRMSNARLDEALDDAFRPYHLTPGSY